jgi:hypothetical protein
MERKGLSQILYLIIAASVLMMIAMVITFTATDTIGGLGGQASETGCSDALQGKCAASATNFVAAPSSTCIQEGQWVAGVGGRMHTSTDPNDDVTDPPDPTTQYYYECP